MALKIDDFSYILPKELIAQKPAKQRDQSRLMVLHPETDRIEHRKFKDIVDYLSEGDVLVLNETRVLKAKLTGQKATGSKAVVTILEKLDKYRCKAMVATKNPLPGTVINLNGCSCTILSDKKDFFIIRFDKPVDDIISKRAVLPTPPYIQAKVDYKRYQTVFAKKDGSLAAPTAGLHFTPELIKKIEAKGVNIVKVCLHIGFGTFMGITKDQIKHRKLHNEYFEISQAAAETINQAKKNKNKVFCVGTTSMRAIESSSKAGKVKPGKGNTDIFIYPGHRFNFNFDGMITNFHLPKSSLLLLVCAFAGKPSIFKAYGEAIRNKYRFFSFGDAMLILNY